MRVRAWIGGCLVALTCTAAAEGAEVEALTVRVGAGQVLDTGGGTEGGVELSFAAGWLGISPTFGGLVSDDGSAYAYLGLRRDFFLGDWVSVTPFTGAGAYHRADGPNLGGSVQFRSGLEVALRLQERGRLSLTFYHLSNAGLKRPNPGTESLVLGYSFFAQD